MEYVQFLKCIAKFEKILMEEAGIDMPFPFICIGIPDYKKPKNGKGGEILMGANIAEDDAIAVLEYYLKHKDRHEEKCSMV